MAADILLYEAEHIPVGGDQSQHVELARDLAARFNATYGETFVVPRLEAASLAARVLDLQDPTRKMSKSAPEDAASVIRILDTPDAIRRKIRRAVTDSGAGVRHDPERRPGVSNLLDILAALTGTTPDSAAEGLSGYGALKTAVADAVIGTLDPIRRRHDELIADPAELERLLGAGAEEARAVAEPVLTRASRAFGLTR